MAPFTQLEKNWRSLDFSALATSGLASVAVECAQTHRDWLAARSYRLLRIDCSPGFSAICKQLSDALRWQENFGYEFEGHSLDALDDGFSCLQPPDEGGLVLELFRPDLCWDEPQARWLLTGALSIAAANSRIQMALGRRFFSLLVIEPGAGMIGCALDPVVIPGCRA